MSLPPLFASLLSVCSLLVASSAPRAQDRVDAERIQVLLIGGQNNHDCEWTTPELRDALEETGRFAVTITTDPPAALADAKALEKFAAFVLDYNGARWGDVAEANFVAAVKAGRGVTIIHAADNSFPGWKEYEEIVGLLWRDGTGHGRFHPFDVHITDAGHPITRGMADIVGHPDELYHRLVNTQGVPVRVLGVAHSDPATGGTGKDEPMIIVGSYGKGRVFHTPLGHVWRNAPDTHVSHQDPQFRRLVARGTEWAATGDCTLEPTPPNWLSPVEKAAGFRLVFDGHDGAGWRGYRTKTFPAKGWKFENGAIHSLAGGEGGDIVSDTALGDFELRFQWAVTRRANSGVIYRATEVEESSYMTGPEYQVFDDEGSDPHPSANTSASALYALAEPVGKSLRPVGTYNDGRIVVRGWHIEHWLNGNKVVDVDLSSREMQQRIAASKFSAWAGFAKSERGLIALQDHGDEVWYRSLRVRDLAPEKKAGSGNDR